MKVSTRNGFAGQIMSISRGAAPLRSRMGLRRSVRSAARQTWGHVDGIVQAVCEQCDPGSERDRISDLVSPRALSLRGQALP